MVNAQILRGNWHSIKGKLRDKWGQLTDDDLESFNGKTEHLIGTIERKTGAAREYIEEVLDGFIEEGGSVLSRAAETAHDYAENAAHAVSRAAETVADGVRGGVAGAGRAVQEHPGSSVAVAFSTGMITGLLMGLFLRMR